MFRRQSDLILGAAMSLAVIAGVWLRWSGLDSQSLWMDERFTIWTLEFSPKVIWSILQPDTSAPLYCIEHHY